MTRTENPADPATAAERPDDAVAIRRMLSRGLLGGDGAALAGLADRLRGELDPRTAIEEIQVDVALIALATLRRVALALPDSPLGDPAVGRAQGQAYRMLAGSLRDLRRGRADRDGKAVAAAARTPPAGVATLPPGDPDIDALPMDPDPDWRARIEFPRGEAALDDFLPATWPRVRGTEHLVEHVAALLVGDEAWTTSQVLVEYPGLTIADLRAVKGCDAENLCGPPPA